MARCGSTCSHFSPSHNVNQLRHCPMCGKAILPADLSNHPRCHGCSILLEPEVDGKALCRCGKYHNAPGVADLLLPVLPGEDIPTGDAEGRAGQEIGRASCRER